MLIKTVNINLKLISDRIFQSVAVLLVGMLFSTALYTFPLAIVGCVALLILCKGYCKLFYNSCYLDEGSLYMTLPIPNGILIWGKVIVCTIWSVLIAMMTVLIAIVMIDSIDLIFIASNGTKITLLTYLTEHFQRLGLTAWQTAVAVGTLPIVVVTFTGFTCLFIMTVQSAVRKSQKGKSRKAFVVLSMVATTVLFFGENKLAEMGRDIGLNYFYTQLIFQAVVVGLIWPMYVYCQRIMDEGFDMV